VDLSQYRNSDKEKERVADLMGLLPGNIETVLDIGARDGFFSKLLAERYSHVTALDLEKPSIDHDRIHCVKGDVTALSFPDGSFDLLFCAEVLEHIPARLLGKACNELSRVSNRYVLLGVPYKQDIRVDRLTCHVCGKKTPSWGHVNSFDENRLRRLFPACEVVKESFAGVGEGRTNCISCLLMDTAGNPYGTYSQDEPCVHCGAPLKNPPERNLLQKVLTRAAVWARSAQTPFLKQHPYWIHMLLEKRMP
jgi:SAM-dependent methyltransferase